MGLGLTNVDTMAPWLTSIFYRLHCCLEQGSLLSLNLTAPGVKLLNGESAS